MSRAFKGGSETYRDEKVPQVEIEVLQILERFIQDNFKAGDEVADEVTGDSDKRIIIFAEDGEQESPATLGQRDGDLIVYGSFSYRARDHGVQTIWENQFEMRDTGDGVYVRVSNWYGTTVESWTKKVERNTLYV